MSDDVIDSLLVKLGVTVDQASFSESTNAVTGLDNAINRAARDRGKNGIDKFGKNLAETGSNAKGLEQVVDKFDKTVARTPRSIGVLQSRLGSATQQMASFRKETQTVVALLSRGASETGLGPLSGGIFSMLGAGGPLALAAAGLGALSANAYMFSNGALSANVDSQTYGVSKGDFQNFNRFGKTVTGEDGVGTQILAAAQKIRLASRTGQIPIGEAQYGASPADFAGAYGKSTMEVVDIIQKQLRAAKDPLARQGIGSELGLNQSGIMTASEDYRTGMRAFDKPGSTFSDQDVANAKAFETSLTNLTADFDRVSNKLGAEFLPTLDDFIKRVDKMMSQGGIFDKAIQFTNKLQSGDFNGALNVLKDPTVLGEASTFVKNHVPLISIAKSAYEGGLKGYQQDGFVGGYKGFVGGYFHGMSSEFPQARKWAGEGFDAAKNYTSEAGDWLYKNSGVLGKKQAQYMQFFTDNGYTKEQAAGIVGNLIGESQLKADAVGDNGQAYGLAQWHPSRQNDFKEFFGRDMKGSSEQDQLDFILYELQNKEKAAGNALAKTRTAGDAALVFRDMYERPADNPADSTRRVQIANQAMLPNMAPLADQKSSALHEDAPELALPNLPPLAKRSVQDSDASVLPTSAPETYNMVANPPAPPSIDLTQSQQPVQAGNTIHIDARGSTDVHSVTSEALRAANDHMQGQMTTVMSHLSTDLDQ